MASMRVCEYVSMQVCKYASMRVCEYASMFNLASMCGSKGLMSTLTPTDRPVQILMSENQNGHHCNALIQLFVDYTAIILGYNTNMLIFN